MQVFSDVMPLSNKLQVAPLKEGEVATFRLTRAFKKVNEREDPTCPEVSVYPGVEQIVDPFDNKNRSKKHATNILSYKQVGNGAEPVFERVKFIKGDAKIGFDNPAMYQFMMRSKHSGANRYRKQMGGKGEPTWILVGQTQVVDQLAIRDMEFHAETMVRKCDQTQLKTIAMKLNSSPDARLHVAAYRPGVKEDFLAIKLALIDKSKLYPKQVLYASDDSSSKKRVEAYDALTLAVLFLNDQGGYSIYTVDDKEEEIHRPDPGKDPMNSLVEFFEHEKGAEAYAKFAKALNRARKIPA